MKDERTSCLVLGAIIGTQSGWDQQDTAAFIFYDLELNNLGKQFLADLNPIPKKLDLTVDYERGQVYYFDEHEKEHTIKPNWGAFA